MRPIKVTLTLQVDADGLAQAQQAAGAGDLTLNGALIASGEYNSTTAQQLGIASVGNLSGVTFTIEGEGYEGDTGLFNESLSEDVTGPNNNTVETSAYFTRVTSISVDGAVGTDVTVGTVDEAVSQPIPLNHYIDYNTGLSLVFSGTADCDVEHTHNNIYSDPDITWITHDNLDGETANVSGNYAVPVSATRLKINSGTDGSSVTYLVMQA